MIGGPSLARRPGPPADLLTAEEERELAARRDAGDASARDELVVRNLPLALSIAAASCRRPGQLEDVAQDAAVGLVLAAGRFDPSRGVRFGTYATWCCRRAIRVARDGGGATIRVPRRARDLLASAAAGRAPSHPTSLACVASAGRALALALASDIAGRDALAGCPARPDDTPSRLDDEALAARALAAMARLPGREARVLRLRLGLGGDDPMTLEAIGRELGVTKERIRQVEAEALARLREIMGSEEAA